MDTRKPPTNPAIAAQNRESVIRLTGRSGAGWTLRTITLEANPLQVAMRVATSRAVKVGDVAIEGDELADMGHRGYLSIVQLPISRLDPDERDQLKTSLEALGFRVGTRESVSAGGQCLFLYGEESVTRFRLMFSPASAATNAAPKDSPGAERS